MADKHDKYIQTGRTSSESFLSVSTSRAHWPLMNQSEQNRLFVYIPVASKCVADVVPLEVTGCSSPSGCTLLFYETYGKNISAEQELSPRYALLADDSVVQAVPEHPKKEHVFCLSNSHGDVYLFQVRPPLTLNLLLLLSFCYFSFSCRIKVYCLRKFWHLGIDLCCPQKINK